MGKKLILKYFILLMAIAVASVLLPSCYEVKTEVIGQGEGIQVSGLPDGIYSSEENELLKIKWEAAAKEYSLEMTTKEGTSLSRVRVTSLHNPYLLVQVYNPDESFPFTLLFVTIEEKAIVIHQPQDSKLEAQLAVKTGAAVKEEEVWKELKTAPAKNIRAFMQELAASGTLKAGVRYQYQGVIK